MKFAVSSIAFLGSEVEEIIKIAKSKNYMLEFSSGLPYKLNMEELYLKSQLERLPHNYFPAPEVPFVLNLASLNEAVLEDSINHCLKGLWLTKESNAPFFAAHAGFCLDPKPFELGKELIKPSDFDRNKHWDTFIKSVSKILEEAAKLEVDFLIENNVVAPFNLLHNGKNPLLCADPLEIGKLFDDVEHPRLGLLLDTAHLKVSANSLKFNLDTAVDFLSRYVRGVHHSDNNGHVDSNDQCDDNYWFIKHFPKFKDMLHVLEIKRITVDDIDRTIDLFKKSVLELD